MEISNYQLGIIFAIGSTSEGRMIFRHRNRYFLEQIQQLTGNKIYIQHSQTGPQYAFKTQNINIDELKCYGWTKRNAEQRNVPMLNDYSDFLRAYIEIHSVLDYSVRYRCKNKKINIKAYVLEYMAIMFL